VADLDELAREWLHKLQPYRYFDGLFNNTDFCPVPILQFLLGKCKVIGVDEFEVYLYMMCDNKLSRFLLTVGGLQCKKCLMNVVKDVGEVRERDLIGKRTHATIAFAGTGVELGVFNNEPVHLGTLRGVNAYLESIWVHTRYKLLTRINPHLFPQYELVMEVAVERGGRLYDTVSVSYAHEGYGIVKRVHMWSTGRELGLWEDEVLALLYINDNLATTVDELLREVSNLLISAFKPLISTSHLASRAFERSA
jgi:hypothetical protein